MARTIVVKLIWIPNDDTQNYHLSGLQLEVETLDTQLNEPTNQNSIKVSNVVKPANKKVLS